MSRWREKQASAVRPFAKEVTSHNVTSTSLTAAYVCAGDTPAWSSIAYTEVCIRSSHCLAITIEPNSSI